MKINQEIRRLAARWPVPSAALLVEAIDRLCTGRKDGSRWSSLSLDGRATSPDEQNALVRFCPFHLSSMRHFRVCHTNEGIWEISAESGGKFDAGLLESVIPRYGAIDLERMRSTRVSYIREGRYVSDNPNDLGEIAVHFGWRTHAGPPGYYLQASCSNPRANAATRYAFITSVIENLDVKDFVRVVGDERDFVLKAANGWSLYELERDWAPHDHNPSFFPIGPFPSFDDVRWRGEHFRATPLGKQIDRLWIGSCVTPDVYETMYEQLNALANEWHVDLYGSYADGIDPYTADASQSPDGRFPVFVWSPARDADGLFYQADIVPTPEGRFLEIHSNCGDMKKLLKEAEAATGVPFVPTTGN